jgi:long-subunit fatty acid transport protein
MIRAGVLACVTALAAEAAAQTGVSFNRTGSGARAAGMANAFIAISDDGTAASWNPSGLAQLRKPELSIVTTTSGDAVTAKGFRTLDDRAVYTVFESSYRSSYPDFASLAVPVTLWGKPVTFQGSWRRLYSLEYRELAALDRVPLVPDGPPPVHLHHDGATLGAVDVISAAAAVGVTSRLSLGAGFNFWRGDWQQHGVVTETSLAAPEPPRFAAHSADSRVRGESYTLGLMLAYPRWSLGLVYQGPLRSDYSTTSEVIATDLPGAGPEAASGTLQFPRSVGVGAAFRPASLWTVAFDLTWDDWTDAIVETPQTGRISLFDGLPPELSATRDTISWNAGAERLFTGDGFVVPLRFGVAWEPQGGTDPYTRDPINFVVLAVGTGYNTNSLKFDAAFQYHWSSWEGAGTFEPEMPSLLLPAAVGRRTASQWRLKLSLILRLTDTDKLKRAAHKVFG